LLIATGSIKTGASAGRPSSSDGQVAIPKVTNSVLRPFLQSSPEPDDDNVSEGLVESILLELRCQFCSVDALSCDQVTEFFAGC
jgi:hypothetical protein